METNALSLACYNAIAGGCLENMDQRWDVATADMLRTSMLKLSMIPQDVSAMEIYRTMLPAFAFGSTETDNSPCSYQCPDKEDFEKAGIDTSFFNKEKKNMKRVYVKMEVIFDEQGLMKPFALHWVNGRRITIDKISDKRNSANLKNDSTGGAGIRYTCTLLGQERYIWFMEGRWFVETKK